MVVTILVRADASDDDAMVMMVLMTVTIKMILMMLKN